MDADTVMGKEHHPEMKGFDSYELTLGDELRGERASKGKSLLDVQRDLRIRADYIDAIENSDASAFPFAGFAAGYVRSYARYLDIDPDDVYRRFCEESGFEGVSLGTVEPTLGAGAPTAVTTKKTVDDLVINNRFATSNAREARLDLGAGLRGLASIGVLAALVVGLGFGGWTVLQNLQRVGFTPLPNAPEVLATAPDIFTPDQVIETAEIDDAPLDTPRISLATLYAEQEITAPELTPRDGPISSIDPMQAGVFAPPSPIEPPIELVVIDDEPPVDAVTQALAAHDRVGEAADALSAGQLEFAQSTGLKILATETAWVRVRDESKRVLFTGTLAAGDRFELPEEANAPVLRAGNAGAVYIVIGGVAFGPLGNGPVVAKNVLLTADAVKATYPAAIGVDIGAAEQETAAVEAPLSQELAQLPLE
jgi:cytoskeleton protein RodZ